MKRTQGHIRLMGNTRPVWGAVLIILIAAWGKPARTAEWWNRAWPYRYPVNVGTPGHRCDAATVDFLHAGRAGADCSNIRVTDADGGIVEHFILQPGPGDAVRVAFRSGGRTGTYYIYLGNKRAGKPSFDWFPEGGLILETRRYNGGNPGSLREMEAIIRHSGPFYGKAFVKHVFHGLNLFGPPQNYVSIYEGTLHAPSSGNYVLCTSSDDASFLLIDGGPVVEWPGWHGAVGDTRHRADTALKAGPHRFRYLHLNGGGPGVAVAAWQPPGARRVRPIQPQDFGWPASATTGPPEGLSGPLPDFQYEVLEEYEVEEDVFLVRAQFTAVPIQGARTVEWDFGDGLTEGGGSVSHVFLKEGDYTVRMRCGKWEVSNHIRIERRWWKAMKGYETDPQRFLDTVKRYDMTRLKGEHLGAAVRFLKTAGEEREALRTAGTALGKMEELPPDTLVETVLFYTDAIRKTNPEEALEILQLAARVLEAHPAELAQVLLAQGDVFFYFLKDHKKALEVYDRVVSRFAGNLREQTVRIARIRIGDLYRRQGRYEDALRAYNDAEELKIYQWPADRLAVRKGALFTEIEQAMLQGDIQTAAEALDTLEWEFPAERLRGESSLLRGRLALKEKNYHEALKQFVSLVGVNPDSPYAPECLHSAALALQALGRPEEAGELQRRLREEYPESPHSQ